jgi:hypothetical protein
VLPTLHIEDDGVPIYVQIREQFLHSIGSGVLRPGEQLPTMRQVACGAEGGPEHRAARLRRAGGFRTVVVMRARHLRGGEAATGG